MLNSRRQTIESRKTVSRKAQTRELARSSQTSASRSTARDHSCHGLDIKDNDDESRNSSVNLVDNEMNPTLCVDTSESWTIEIDERMQEIKERKRSTAHGREKALSRYINLLISHYAYDEIEGKTRDLFPALIKSIKVDSSEKEARNALLAIALTVVTAPSEVIYDSVAQELKRAYRNSKFNLVKSVAINTLSIVAAYGGASDYEVEEIMDELIDILESDGNSIDAPDSAEVVTSACEAWGHLATFLCDLEWKTETAMDAFVEQLNGGDVNVQIAAGENIALLFEKSYTEREADDEPASKEDDDEGFLIDSNYVKRYEAYRQKNQLLYTLKGLANESSKHIAKKDRKKLHASFSDIISTIEYPTRGPRFQNAIDMETGKMYGSRVKVHIRKKGSLHIDKWWKMFRYNALKGVLGGGFLVHFEENDAVIDCLGPMKSKG